MEQFKGMKASVEGLKIAIGNELFPVLTPVIEGMRYWLDANRDWMAAKFGEEVKYLSDTIKAWADRGGLRRLGDDMRDWSKQQKWVCSTSLAASRACL